MGQEDRWVVVRLGASPSDALAFPAASVLVEPGALMADEANGSLRLARAVDAPFVVRGAVLLPDGSARLAPEAATLRFLDAEEVLAVLAPDLVRLDLRPDACTVNFPASGRSHAGRVGTAAAAGEEAHVRLGPDAACPGLDLRLRVLGTFDAP